jgi:hypothetical protein
LHGGDGYNFSVQLVEGRVVWRCWSQCQIGGDVLELLRHLRGLGSFREIVQEAQAVLGLTPETWTPRPSHKAKSQQRPFPPRAEVQRLWDGAGSLIANDQAAQYVADRLGDDAPALVDALDLARVVSVGSWVPPWARFRGDGEVARTWLETGHRLILPAVDHHGAVRSLRAWRIVDGDTPKRLPPSGHRASGLVLADGLARQVLEAASLPEWWPAGEPFDVLLAEGEPDYVTLAILSSDANEVAPAVIGITSGGFNADFAARLPANCRATLCTHHDPAGHDYANRIGRLLVRRGIEVRRTTP